MKKILKKIIDLFSVFKKTPHIYMSVKESVDMKPEWRKKMIAYGYNRYPAQDNTFVAIWYHKKHEPIIVVPDNHM